MIHGIARYAAGDWTDTTMAGPARFAENHVLMLSITHLADGRVTRLVDPADFAGGQTDLGKTFVTRHQSRRATRTADHLATTSGCQFNVMNEAAHRNRTQRKTVSNFRRSR